MAKSGALAFIGLGVMGYPMAGHLARSGHHLTVFNRSGEKAQRFVDAHGAVLAPTPAEAARRAEAVFLCVGDDTDLRAVTGGEQGVIAGLQSDAVLVDHTTASPELARELSARAAEAGAAFLDAPVSGGQQGAEKGELTIMAGGTESAFARIEPLWRAYAKRARLMGPAGAGQLTKMVNQICIAGLLQGLAEGLHFAECAGLDIERVLEAVSQGAAQSWQMDHRGHSMAAGEFEFGFAVDWMRKDLAIALDTGRRLGAPLPATALIDQFYGDVQALGGRRWDTSSLIERLRAASGRGTPHARSKEGGAQR